MYELPGPSWVLSKRQQRLAARVGRLLPTLHLPAPRKRGGRKLRAPTYVGDCVSVEFSHGLDAFETCHQSILTFQLNHGLQGTEAMACEEGSVQEANPCQGGWLPCVGLCSQHPHPSP